MTLRFLFVFLLALLIGSGASAQLEQGASIIQAGGGWSSVIIESTGDVANGYILNASYENWLVAPVGIGGSVHYMHVKQENERGSAEGTSLPIYLDAKYYFGKSRLKIFVIGSAGLQFSWRKLEGTSGTEGSDHDAGFSAGFGTGLVYNMNPGILINFNYNLYLMNNAYYSNGLANTVSINVGFILGK